MGFLLELFCCVDLAVVTDFRLNELAVWGIDCNFLGVALIVAAFFLGLYCSA